jgi:hypothetical protein
MGTADWSRAKSSSRSTPKTGRDGALLDIAGGGTGKLEVPRGLIVAAGLVAAALIEPVVWLGG